MIVWREGLQPGQTLAVADERNARQFSRPATADDVKRLVRALNEAGVEYLLIGGYALLAHGYQRATVDIDGVPVRTLDLEGLLKTKTLSDRPKDVSDRQLLERVIEEAKRR